MTHQKLPCRFCGMNFEAESDRREHEACHVPVGTAPNSHPEDGGPEQIVWQDGCVAHGGQAL